jgi:hypothetical protein
MTATSRICKQNDGVEFPVSLLITAGRKNTVNTPSKTNGMKEFTDPYLTHIYSNPCNC